MATRRLLFIVSVQGGNRLRRAEPRCDGERGVYLLVPSVLLYCPITHQKHFLSFLSLETRQERRY